MKIIFIKLLIYLNNNLLMRFIDKSSRNFVFNSKLNKNQLYASPTKRQMMRFQSTIIDNGGFFKSLNKLLEDLDGNICLDVGSNLGYWSIAFNRYLKREKIIFSFEPQRRNMNYLSYNLRNERNIILLQLGLSSKIEDLSLGIPSYTHKRGGEHAQNTGNMSVFHDDESLDCIRFITIDSFLNGIINKEEKVFLIKIDVEGFEKEVIDGMMGCVEIHRPLVILEINPDTQVIAEYDLRKVLEKFLNRNYKFAVPESSALVIDKKGVPNISLNMLLCPEENFKKVGEYVNYKNFNYK